MGVIVVGSANVDLVTNAPRMPVPGETLMGTRFEQLFGGKGANQAVAAALLGSAVTMVAKLGTDSLGEASLENFRSLGVDTACVSQTDEAASGVAQITVDASGQNEIVIVPGANGLLSSRDVAAATGAFKQSRVLLTQLEVPLPTTIAALRAGKEAGVLTIFNSAPAPTEPLPDELYPLCDVICPNETETGLLTGMPTGTLEECEAAARAIIAKGAKAVVLTLGERGCMLVTADEAPYHVAVPPDMGSVTAVDTTGAGDGFLGALAHFVASGRSLRDALPGAVRVASVSVQRRGAQGSYPTSKDLPAEWQVAVSSSSLAPAKPLADAAELPNQARRLSVTAPGAELKRAVGYHACDEFVRSDMTIGVGTGETVGFVLERLAQRIADGSVARVFAVPTSEKTAAELKRLGVPSVSLDTHAHIDVAIGSADAVDDSRNVIKGGKGALLREKLVYGDAHKNVVVVDEAKRTAKVGASYPVPVEIAQVYAQRTVRNISALASLAPCDARLRYGDAPAGLDGVTPFPPKPFVTDNGNFIVDVFRTEPIVDVAAAAAELKSTAGVVEHGLFVGLSSSIVLLGTPSGVVNLAETAMSDTKAEEADVVYKDVLAAFVDAGISEMSATKPDDPYRKMYEFLFQASLVDYTTSPAAADKSKWDDDFVAKFGLVFHGDAVIAGKAKGQGPKSGVKFMLADAGDFFSELSKKMKATGAPLTGVMTAEELRAADAAAMKMKREKEAKEQAARDEADAANAVRAAEMEASGKKVTGGLHKFDASEVDIYGGEGTADDLMDAFGF